MLLGPDSVGKFMEVRVTGIHNKRVGVERVEAGQLASFAIKSRRDVLHKEHIRKGMVLVEKKLKPQATWWFKAEVLILVHPTTLKRGFSPLVHCVTARQCARIMNMSGDTLRSGDRATVAFQWCHRPEYMREGMRIIFREGRTRGIGVVTNIMPAEPRKWFDEQSDNKLEQKAQEKKEEKKGKKGSQKEKMRKPKKEKGKKKAAAYR